MLLAVIAQAKEQKAMRLSLLQAVKEHKVIITAKSSSTLYNQKGLLLSIENTGKENIILEVDPAMVFSPEDAQYQNLIIEGFDVLVVNAGKSRIIGMQSYCGESSDRAPVADLPYRYARQGDSIMIKTLKFIRDNKVKEDMAQHALWVLTDNHDLSDVYDERDPALSRHFTAFMGKLLGVAAPQYFTVKELNATPGELVSNQKVLKLVTNLQWSLSRPESLSLSIYNTSGEKVASYFDHKAFPKGEYDLNASFETIDYPEGRYTIKLYSDRETLKQMIVELQ
ncbi:hypothetical protein DBR32_13030 [Taibaiella sp. KBW10]|nr:hypothetical protein DBR32_13030 [Taibaiella sp. KBW10]